MSHESEVAVLLAADTAFMAIMTGGVYKAETVGREGITRDAAAAAFDGTTGYLKPCVFVKQRDEQVDGMVSDGFVQIDSAWQVVELWFYEDSGYTAIDAGKARARTVLRGKQLSNSFELRPAGGLDRRRDPAMGGASMERQDWQVNYILT